MAKQVTEKTKEIHRMYEECRKVFEPSLDLFDEISNIEDETEREFFIALCNLFLQQGQKEALAKEGF